MEESSCCSSGTAETVFNESLSLFHRKTSPESRTPPSHTPANNMVKPPETTQQQRRLITHLVYRSETLTWSAPSAAAAGASGSSFCSVPKPNGFRWSGCHLTEKHPPSPGSNVYHIYIQIEIYASSEHWINSLENLVQKNLNIEKITFKDVQMKYLAMHINTFWYIYGRNFTWS